MPLFMDRHNVPGGVTLETAKSAHAADLAVQAQHGVTFRAYWVSEPDGAVFCLLEAPHADAAQAVHREAHGLVADELFEVVEGE
jgi:hypothetical protein